jgi:hypothetical protein
MDDIRRTLKGDADFETFLELWDDFDGVNLDPKEVEEADAMLALWEEESRIELLRRIGKEAA